MKRYIFPVISSATVTLIIVLFVVFGVFSSKNPEVVPVQGTSATADSSDSQATTSSAAAKAAQNTTQAASSSPGAAATQAPSASDRATTAPKGATLLEGFNAINQLPELPTGCEITSLAMTLNYLGAAADKCDLADNFLEKGETGSVDFHEAFLGDPRDDSNSYGCYAPVLINAANKYLSTTDSLLRAKDVSGHELESLFKYIDSGTPVIVWGTRYCEEAQPTVTWEVNGKTLQWIYPEHCMVLVGYDSDGVYEADPLTGDIERYDTELFRKGYNALYRQAIVITSQ